MRTTLRSLLVLGALVAAPAALRAQDVSDEDQPHPPGHWAINLTVGGSGLSIGNSARVNGLRINWSDYGLERVNGVNLTLWKPHKRLSGVINGAAIGVVGPGASEINGLAVGLAGTVTDRRMRGVSLAGLGVVSQGSITGIAVSGLGTVSQRTISGLAIAGLGAVAEGSVTGILVGGLGAVSQGHIHGLAVSGLGTVSQGGLTGVGVSGLAVVTQGDLKWLSIAGLATVAQGDITGFTASGLATVSQGRVAGVSLNGLALVTEGGFSGVGFAGAGFVSQGRVRGAAISVYRVEAPRLSGFSVAGYLKVWDFTGLGVGVYNRVRTQQTGLTIGIVNYARRLQGFQLGLINIAGNNRGLAKVLPIVNAHL